MFGWIPAVIYLFRWVPPQRAVIISFITAWLFLPEANFVLPGIPDYTKMSATCYGILLATILFDINRFKSFQPSWLDLPMLTWCLCPFASSISNDLGLYDGISSTLEQTMTWGVPYYLGRLYLNNLDGLRKLAIDMFIGGLIYIPLCLLEIRLSPVLHPLFYGFYYKEDFGLVVRYGAYRPVVFMSSGLMVGAWMMIAALVGVWLWRTRVLKHVWNIPMTWLVPALLVTVVLVRSTAAWLLLALGLLTFFAVKRFRTSLIVVALILSSLTYIYVGATGTLSGGEPAVAIASEVFGPDRAQSLKFRFDNEKFLAEKARQRPIFGWGGYDRNLVTYTNEYGVRVPTITDSLWIIAFSMRGIVGLVSITASLLLPAIAFLYRYPTYLWTHRKVAPAAALSVSLVLYMLDCVLNAMVNPIYTLVAGGIVGVVLEQAGASKEIDALAEPYPAQQRQQ